jgi:small subunit ribosomal protein S20
LHFIRERVILPFAGSNRLNFAVEEVVGLPNIKSAKKRVAVAAAKTAANRMIRSRMRTNVKTVRLAALNDDTAAVQDSYRVAQKRIDQAVAKGIIHKNKAARMKSQLIKLVK